jgi:hypothetical protein
MPVRFPDSTFAKWIRVLHTNGLTYRQIAQKPYFVGIPPGTLCAIAKGYGIPEKWRKVLGLPPLKKVPTCPRCGIAHTYDCQTQNVKNAEPPRNLRRCTIYRGTPPDEVVAKLERIGHKVKYE